MNYTIVYVGNDPDFVQELNNVAVAFTKNKAQWKIVVLDHNERSFKHILSTKDVIAILMDYSDKKKAASEEECLHYIAYKQLSAGRATPIIGLFADKDQLIQNRHLFMTGMTFSHVKGADTQLFLKDMVWLAAGFQDHLGGFATSKRLDLTTQVFSIAGCVSLTSNSMSVDCDFVIPDGTKVLFPPFGEMVPLNIAVESYYPQPTWHDSFYSLKVRIDYPGPWDTPDATTLTEDTLSTWISLAGNSTTAHKALVYSKRQEVVESILSLQDSKDIRIAYSTEPTSLKQQLLTLSPDLLFLDLMEEDDSSEILYMLKDTMSENTDWMPYVLVYNCKVSQEESKNILNCERILVSTSSLDARLFESILALSKARFPRKAADNEHQFSLDDSNHLVDVSLEVFVTSISEHEITFFCPAELPMYSILHMNLPVDMYLLVVPQFRPLSNSSRGTHYQTIIHGISQAEENTLRQYVNAIIFDPPKVFGEWPAKPVPVTQELAPVEEPNNIKKVVGDSFVAIEQARINRVKSGKSKL